MKKGMHFVDIRSITHKYVSQRKSFRSQIVRKNAAVHISISLVVFDIIEKALLYAYIFYENIL
jgi:hypothetical protein